MKARTSFTAPCLTSAPPSFLGAVQRCLGLAACLGAAALALAAAPGQGAAQRAITTADMEALYARPIGPATTGGRIHDVEVVPGDPSTILVGTASGGLWKTTNRGTTWTNVFFGMPVSTFGDIAIAPSNPRVVYAGTGEQQNRQSSSYGNGVYRSDDGGDTWRHMGLDETRHTGKIVVHPTNPDVVWVGGLGNLWAPSEDRGVFKSVDGGESWSKVLYVDTLTGVIDLEIDTSNPDVLYAATYQRLRRAWGFNGGGPGSGIYKSTDGGETWQELTGGIPDSDKGRIGIALSESNPNVLMALIETADSETTGVYRSENAGATWEMVNDQNIRPMYYSHIYIDPNDDERVYTLATRSYVSDDGGRTFSQIALAPTYDVGIHADHHDLWINPDDPNHLYMVGDAGMHESYDRGINFRRMNNFPIAQFYAIGVDMQDPYWVYGGLQDNHSFFGPSENRRWAGILNDDWMQNGFGDGMYWQSDFTDPRFAYGSSQNGGYFRYDTRTGDMVDISPEPPLGLDYRFDWTSPMMLSRHDPDVLYVAGNHFFTSTDRGGTWSRTEDLSRGVDRDTLSIMGVEGIDISISRNDGTSSFGEAVTLDESPLDPDVLWLGFDDGNLQVSRDGGTSWAEVSGNVPGVRPGTYVSRITASAASAGTAYAAFDGHRDGDFRPYLFRTTDYGATWTPLHATLPEMGVVNDVIEHPDNPDALFVGTEHHAFASTDRGANWAKIPNLPTTHYDDILIHPRDKDLVLGTHGQGIWILDDTEPVAEFGSASGAVTVFTVPDGRIKIYKKDTSYRGQEPWAGKNPPNGVHVTYRIASGTGDATLRITNASGRTVREMTVPGGAGMHRVNWCLRHGLPSRSERWERWDNPVLARPIGEWGPWVSPGTYTATVVADGAQASSVFRVEGDPDMPITQAMYESRERFMLEALGLQDRIQTAMRQNGMGGGGGGFFGGGPERPPQTPEEKLRAAHRLVGGVYRGMNGGGVRQATLYPPTQSQTERVALAQRLYEEAMAELDDGHP